MSARSSVCTSMKASPAACSGCAVSGPSRIALMPERLTSQSGISAIRLGPLTAYLEQAAGDAFMLVQALDLALIGLTLLYRSRRVSAELYLQILGGFVRPAIVH